MEILLLNEIGIKTQSTIYRSLALDEYLCGIGIQENQRIFHLWDQHPVALLGLLDDQLPYREKGIAYLQSQNYDVAVRPSGGNAVLLDKGILCISLILPGQAKMEEAYLEYVQYLSNFIQPFVPSISVGEVANAYCPGKYDLHVDGKKIAGISQRRVRQGVSVHGYIAVTGNEHERLSMIREFYELSQRRDCVEKYRWQFGLKESAVTTLTAFTPEVTVSAVTAEILRQLPEHRAIKLDALEREESFKSIVDNFTKRMKR